MTNSNRSNVTTLRKMTSILNSAFLLSGLITICSSNLQIISSPQTVSNATLGSTVRFVCQTSITSVLPGWNINGTDYRVTELPLGYRSESYLTSNVLIVSPVEIAMNNSVYFCFVTSFTSEGRQVRIESEPAMIIIRVPNYSCTRVYTTVNSHSPAHGSSYNRVNLCSSSIIIFPVPNYSSLKDTALQVKDTATNSVQDSITPLKQKMSTLSTNYLTATPGVIAEHSTPAVPKYYYTLQHKIQVMVITLASAILVLLLTSTIAVSVWIYRHRRKKGTKCTGQQVYDDISAALPSVHPNPSYEQCKLKVEKNPAYEFTKKPQSHGSSNLKDHVYDVIEELQKTS